MQNACKGATKSNSNHVPPALFLYTIFLCRNLRRYIIWCQAGSGPMLTTWSRLWQGAATACLQGPGDGFNIKMPFYQDRKSHCGDKPILRPSYLPMIPMTLLVADRMAPVTRSQLDIRSWLSNSVIRCLYYRGVRMLETGDWVLALAQPPSYKAMGGSSNESEAYS